MNDLKIMSELRLARHWREIEKKLRKETNIKHEHLATIKMFIDLVEVEALKYGQNSILEKLAPALISKSKGE